MTKRILVVYLIYWLCIWYLITPQPMLAVRFWYYVAFYSQRQAYKLGRIGLLAENRYHKAMDDVRLAS